MEKEIQMKTCTKYVLLFAATILLAWAAAYAQSSPKQPSPQPSSEQINYGKSFNEGRTIETIRYQNRMMELGQEQREAQQMAQLHRTECITQHRNDAQGSQSCTQAAQKEADEKSLDHQRKLTAEEIHHDRIMLALRTHWNGR
jgi:hypothetical protein